MIETITLRNFKGHTETVIPCARFTVLVGENASGKTSVLKALKQTGTNAEKWTSDFVRTGTVEAVVRLVGVTSGERWCTGARARLKEPFGSLEWFGSLDDDSLPKPEVPPQFIDLSLEPRSLAAVSHVKSVPPTLEPNGYRLSSLLAYLKLEENERFQRVVDRVRQVVPFIRNIVPRHTASGEGNQYALFFDFSDATNVPAALASEGTLLALGTITALEAAKGADVVLLDDIDRALHPRAQRDFVSVLRAILAQTPDVQIIATSHSPYLLDAFTPDEAVVLGRDGRGVIVAHRLSDFPDGHLRAMLSTGELWISEGDRWVAA